MNFHQVRLEKIVLYPQVQGHGGLAKDSAHATTSVNGPVNKPFDLCAVFRSAGNTGNKKRLASRIIRSENERQFRVFAKLRDSQGNYSRCRGKIAGDLGDGRWVREPMVFVDFANNCKANSSTHSY